MSLYKYFEAQVVFIHTYIRKDKWVFPKFNQYIFHLANYYH